MRPPLVCFVTWNRAGLTARNLTALLRTTDDFELYIIDNNSQDDTWEFIQGLNDKRIKCRKRFDANLGLVYAVNYALSQRKKDQYFIIVENDVCVKTKNWVSQFIKAMKTFPEAGIISAAYWVVKGKENPTQVIKRNDLFYYQNRITYLQCSCWSPEVFKHIGYLNEETLSYDLDIWSRINRFTPFKMGYINTIEIDQVQKIPCGKCLLKDKCSLLEKSTTCFELRKEKYVHLKWANLGKEKSRKYLEEISSGKRSPYCASIHDPDSIKKHYYNSEWAKENFQFYIDNAN